MANTTKAAKTKTLSRKVNQSIYRDFNKQKASCLKSRLLDLIGSKGGSGVVLTAEDIVVDIEGTSVFIGCNTDLRDFNYWFAIVNLVAEIHPTFMTVYVDGNCYESVDVEYEIFWHKYDVAYTMTYRAEGRYTIQNSSAGVMAIERY